MALKPGDIAPDFTLPDQNGTPVSLGAFKGKRTVVLYFYPYDETRGCTAEACRFRDDYEVFTAAGAEVIGVSSDSVTSHAGFAAHHRLPFTLLSDGDGAVRKLYRVGRQLLFIPARTTFIINRDGVIRHVFAQLFNAERHVDLALAMVRSLA
ncbi:MAG: peroxiredoxin [Gemmatimonadales bacterium]